MAYLRIADNKSIYYEYYPGRGPAVILVHGWGLNVRAWDTTLNALVGKGRAVIAFDQRACGRSDMDFQSASIDDGAGDVVNLVKSLGLGEVVLNGWSLGGAIAVEAARQLGATCKGLVLTCAAAPRYTNTAGFTSGVQQADLDGMASAFRRDKAATSLAVATACFAPGRSTTDIEWVQRMFLDTGPMAIQTLEALGPLDQRALMKALRVPTLVIAGEVDTVTPLGLAQSSHELIAGSRLAVLPGCAHVPMVEGCDEYHALLFDFIKS